MEINEFSAALQRAKRELLEVEAEQQRNASEQQQLAQRRNRLLQSIAVLAPLVGEEIPNEALTLADAMRMVMSNTALADPKATFNAKKIRDLLRGMGFDVDRYNNPLASIHTAMQRMIAAGELVPYGDPDIGGYQFKGRNPIYKLAEGTRFPKR